MVDPARLGPLDAPHHAAVPGVVAGEATALAVVPPMAQFVFRGRTAAMAGVQAAFGLALPHTACRASTHGPRAALWLGPDEFLLLAPQAEQANVAPAFAAALADLPYALVDVGHRNIFVEVAGPDAATVLNAGCPLDLDVTVFPVGACSRTILGKAQIVLWRRDHETFDVGVWRSFAAYAWQFLDEARSVLP